MVMKKKKSFLYELDNSKKKIFFEKKISKFFLIDRSNLTRFSETRMTKMSFFDRFLTKVKIFFDRSFKFNAVFRN